MWLGVPSAFNFDVAWRQRVVAICLHTRIGSGWFPPACLRVDSTTVRMPFACRSSSSTDGYHSSADARAAAPARASAGPARAEGTARARWTPGGTRTRTVAVAARTRTRTRTSSVGAKPARGRGEGRIVIYECNAVFPPAGASLTAWRGRAHWQGRRRRRGRRAQGGPPAGRGQEGEVRAAS